MKNIVIALAMLMLCTVTTADVRILGRDYGLTDSMEHFASAGLLTWHTKEHGTDIGVYGSICWLQYNDIARFEFGLAGCPAQDDMRPLTGVSTPIRDRFTLGIWMSPFWNLYDPDTSDDPWGIMAGYRF